MKMYSLLLVIWISFGYTLAQDTLYFSKLDVTATAADYHYYRLFSVLDSVVSVTDYYSSGVLKMSGNYTLPDSGVSLHTYLSNGACSGHEVSVFSYFTEKGELANQWYYAPFPETIGGRSDTLLQQSLFDTIRGNICLFRSYSSQGLVVREGLVVKKRLPHGIWYSYFKSGELYQQEHYDQGITHGPQITYFTDQNRMYLYQYYYGVKHGDQIYYDWDGIPKKKKVYRYGKLVGKSKISSDVPVTFQAPIGF